MQKFKVTGVKVAFGPGFVLALSKAQAEIRTTQIKLLKNDRYTVLTRVELKRGEIFGADAKGLPKSWLDMVEVLDKEKSDPQTSSSSGDFNTGDLKAVHRGFGKWDVVDASGTPVNTEPLKKVEAQELVQQTASKEPVDDPA